MKLGILLAGIIAATISLPVVSAEVSFSTSVGDGNLATKMVDTGYQSMAEQNITQNTDPATIMPGNSVACLNSGGHADNSYYRRFDLDGDHGFSQLLDVSSVDIGIETATGAAGSQPVEVRLYALANADDLLLANLVLIGSASFDFADASLTVSNFPVTGTVNPLTDDLVVELFTPNGQTAGNIFFIGSNNLGEIAPSYLAAAACGITEPATIGSLGFPNMHIVMVVNLASGSITVVKETTGADDIFSFVSASSLRSFDITTSGNTGQKTFDGLPSGTYDITELVPAGWELTESSCTDGSQLPVVDLGFDENVICTFKNTQLASITVIKETVGGDDTFGFTSRSGIKDFAITTTGGTGEQLIGDLPPGSYDLAETVPAGWSLTGSSCSDGSSLSNIELAAGEAVTCTFKNTRLGSIEILKKTAGGDATFDFTSTTSSGDFQITTVENKGTESIEGLQPGSYKLAETVPAGWSLAKASCDDGGTLPDVEVAPGEAVTCIFNNVKLGSITLVKHTVGADGTFGFTSTSIAEALEITTSGNRGEQVIDDLPPGTYDIAETVPDGWLLTQSACSDGNTPSVIELAAGENVTCTFENTLAGSIRVIKKTVGEDGTFGFISSNGNFNITTVDNAGQELIDDLLPGTYQLSETVPAGWSLTNASCDDGSILPDVALATGEQVTCTFLNTQDAAQLKITKSATPASYVLLGDTIDYRFLVENTGNVALTDILLTDPLPGLSIIDCDGTGSNIIASLAPSFSVGCEAMYSITQADLDAGFVTNQASATAKDPTSGVVTVDSNQVTISKLVDVCYAGALTIPDGMIFAGAGTTTYSATLGIDTQKLAVIGVMVEAPHLLILKAPVVEFNPLFDVEADVDLQNPPGGGQMQVVIGPVTCPGELD